MRVALDDVFGLGDVLFDLEVAVAESKAKEQAEEDDAGVAEVEEGFAKNAGTQAGHLVGIKADEAVGHHRDAPVLADRAEDARDEGKKCRNVCFSI